MGINIFRTQSLRAIKYLLIITGSWMTIAAITQTNRAHDHQYYDDIVLRIVVALLLGACWGIICFTVGIPFIKKLSKPNVDTTQLAKAFSFLHLPLYLLWLYVLRLEIPKVGGINQYLPTIVLLGIMGGSLFLLRHIDIQKYSIYLFIIGAIANVAILSLLWVLPLRGLAGVYYDNVNWIGNQISSQRDLQIDLEKVSQHQETFPQRNFSITWSGWLRIDHEGEYTFSTISDDGSSLFIDEYLIVDNGGSHASRRRSGTVFLTKGLHKLNINYFQGAGDYELKVLWIPPGKTESYLPPLLLYSQPFPIRGMGVLARNLVWLYPLSWLLLGVVMVSKNIVQQRENVRILLKAYGINFAISGVTILLVLFVAEGTLRFVFYIRERQKNLHLLLKESEEMEFTGRERIYSLKGMVQASPYDGMVYELKPNLRGVFAGVPFFTNSQGWRDFEYSYQKNEKIFRIAGLGDSCLFGWGVKLEDTTLKILERKLNQLSPTLKYEIMNFAVPGYNTAMEVELFIRKGLKYSPDLVILHFFDNDYDAPFFMKKPQNYTNLRKSYLIDFIYSRYKMLHGTQHENAIEYVDFDENPDILEEYQYMSGAKGFTTAIQRLVTITKEHNIPLIVYSAKAYPGLHDSYFPYRPAIEQLELITRLSQEQDFFFLNTYPYYVKYMEGHPGIQFPQDFKILDDNVHFNAAAHQLDAEALHDFLIAHKSIAKLSIPE